MHNLQQATGGIGLHVNANKTECMCFKQKGAISIVSGKPLKLVNQFPYLSNNISSIERNVNRHLAKVLNAIDRLLIIKKSYLFNEIRLDLFPSYSCSHTTIWMHHRDTNKTHWEKARWELHKNAACSLEQILEVAPH